MTKHLAIARRALLFGLPAGLLCVRAVQAKDSMAARIAQTQSHLSDAIRNNDATARAGLYLPNARSLPEYQPALYGTAAIMAYHRALLTRKQVTSYTATTTEIIGLVGAAIEAGTFEIAWGDGKSEAGKYLNLWSLTSDEPRLMADTWGYFRPLPDPQAFYVDLPPGRAPTASADQDIKRQLDDLNRRNAEAVRAKDAETQIGFYTEDAAFMPHAETTKSGIADIAAHLRRYVQNGSGATFDTVEVWNEGFDVFAAHVTEYSRFLVRWRTPDGSGVVTGGGIRLWKRMPDGQLKKYRALGTHYHNA